MQPTFAEGFVHRVFYDAGERVLYLQLKEQTLRQLRVAEDAVFTLHVMLTKPGDRVSLAECNGVLTGWSNYNIGRLYS
jgi:hypothetical protein